MAQINFLQSDTDEYIYPVTLIQAIFNLDDGTTLIDTLNDHVDEMKRLDDALHYSTTVPVSKDIGGISYGTKYISAPLKDVIDELLHPWIAPSIEIIYDEDLPPGTYLPTTTDTGDSIEEMMDSLIDELGGQRYEFRPITIQVTPSAYAIQKINVYTNLVYSDGTLDTFEQSHDFSDGDLDKESSITINDVFSDNTLTTFPAGSSLTIGVNVIDESGNSTQQEIVYYFELPALIMREEVSQTVRDQTDEEIKNSSVDPPVSLTTNYYFNSGLTDWTVESCTATINAAGEGITITGRTTHATSAIAQNITGKISLGTKYRVQMEIKLAQNISMAFFPTILIYADDGITPRAYIKCIPSEQSLAILSSTSWTTIDFSIVLSSLGYSDINETTSVTFESGVSASTKVDILLETRSVTDGVINTTSNLTTDVVDFSIRGFSFTPVRTTIDYVPTYYVKKYVLIEHGEASVHLPLSTMVEQSITFLLPKYTGNITSIIDPSNLNLLQLFDKVPTTGILDTYYNMYTTVPVHGDPATAKNYITLDDYSLDVYFTL